MIQGLNRLLNFIGLRGTLIMPIGVVIGLLFPILTQLTRPMAESIVIFMLIVSIYRLNPNSIKEKLHDFKIIGVGILWLLLLMPVVTFMIGHLIGIPSGLLAVITAWSACPPLVSMPGLAILIGLDGAIALLVMIGGTLLFTISLPIILSALVGQSIGLNPLSMALELFSIVSISFLIAQGLRWSVGVTRARASEGAADGILVISMALFAVTIMGGLHDAWTNEPERLPLFLSVAVIMSASAQVLNAIIFQRLNRRTGGAIALASGSRNLALLIPIASGTFAEDLWIFIAVIQIPIYFLPIISKPLYQTFYIK
jgi:predicted Na+-dependent transporter